MTDEDWRKEMIEAEKHARKMRSDHRWAVIAELIGAIGLLWFAYQCVNYHD